MTKKFIVGQVGAPFGVKGFVKVHSFSGEVEHLLKMKSAALISKDGQERIYQIDESVSSFPPVVFMRFAGIESPEAAKTLNGAQLLADREQAAPLREGEFYIEDLKGLPIVTEDGENFGCVIDIIEGGGGELVEAKRANGEKLLIPFRKEFLKVTEGKIELVGELFI